MRSGRGGGQLHGVRARRGVQGRMGKSSKTRPPQRAALPRRNGLAGVRGEQPLNADGRRHIMADYLKSVGSRLVPDKRQPPPGTTVTSTAAPHGARPTVELKLSPRLRQTLDRLLAGDSEKQVARHLALSKNTVHVYVKALYREYNVNSRGELLAKFVNNGNGAGGE